MLENPITVTEDGEIQVAREVINTIIEVDAMAKQAKHEMDEIKRVLKEGMEKYGIKKIDSKELLVTYVEETESLQLDRTALKKKYPSEYNECLKLTPKSAYVKVTRR